MCLYVKLLTYIFYRERVRKRRQQICQVKIQLTNIIHAYLVTSAEKQGNVFTFVGLFICLTTRLLKKVYQVQLS